MKYENCMYVFNFLPSPVACSSYFGTQQALYPLPLLHLHRIRRVNDKAKLDVALDATLPRSIHRFWTRFDQLDLRQQIVLGAKVNHLLRLPNSTNAGSRNAKAAADECKRTLWHGTRRHATDHNDGAPCLEAVQVRVDVVREGDGVVDKVLGLGRRCW